MTSTPERGAIEALPLAVLTFVVGTLAISHAWAVVAARHSASTAARAGAGAAVESSAATTRSAAHRATELALADSPVTWTVDVEGGGGRCVPVTVRITGRVPLLRLPWIGPSPAIEVGAAHSAIVDPYRTGRAGTAACHG